MDLKKNQLESRFYRVFEAYNSNQTDNKPSSKYPPQPHKSPIMKYDILRQWLQSLPQSTHSFESVRQSSEEEEEKSQCTFRRRRSHFSFSKPISSSSNASTASDEIQTPSPTAVNNPDWISRWLRKNVVPSSFHSGVAPASTISSAILPSHCQEEDKNAAEQQKALVTRLLEKSFSGSQKKEQTVDKKRFKTELCRRYFGSGSQQCEYEGKCQFAHSLSELRLIQRHPKYKTDICLAYQNYKKNCGSTNCAYGSRCHFIHDETEEEVSTIHLRMELYRRYKAKYPSAQDVILSDVIEKLNLLDLCA